MPIITVAGQKYRYLEVGEIIKEGDIFIPDDDEEGMSPGFLFVWDRMLGQVYDYDMEPIVRKINE